MSWPATILYYSYIFEQLGLIDEKCIPSKFAQRALVEARNFDQLAKSFDAIKFQLQNWKVVEHAEKANNAVAYAGQVGQDKCLLSMMDNPYGDDLFYEFMSMQMCILCIALIEIAHRRTYIH